jgi:hypothetical protein
LSALAQWELSMLKNILEGKVPRCELSALRDPNLPLGRLILDCLHETETAMAQRHAFKAAELCLKAQAKVQRIE